ncbi:hypothetical protein HanPSC8_Chr10g0420421 [Helianthus annuus]|nr:hypothetical protein HanPSC8_Chr10g0420421 [Helianthus annuus]
MIIIAIIKIYLKPILNIKTQLTGIFKNTNSVLLSKTKPSLHNTTPLPLVFSWIRSPEILRSATDGGFIHGGGGRNRERENYRCGLSELVTTKVTPPQAAAVVATLFSGGFSGTPPPQQIEQRPPPSGGCE